MGFVMTTCKKQQAKANLQKTATRLVAVNEAGRRIGEDHPAARLTDRDIENMRRIHEEFTVGHPQHVGYRRLSAMFNCTKTLARKICNYAVRAQTTARFKRGT